MSRPNQGLFLELRIHIDLSDQLPSQQPLTAQVPLHRLRLCCSNFDERLAEIEGLFAASDIPST
jgi:hypothetical protein